MSPLFLVNWHRVHVGFRALMWLVACALALVILLSNVHRTPAPGQLQTIHGGKPHMVVGTIRATP